MKDCPTILLDAVPITRARAADFLELTRPRIALLVLFTVAAGALLASPIGFDWMVLAHGLIGTALVASGASALNQFLERDTDALMARTENRPLPAGRLHPWQVLIFGLALGFFGLAYLAVVVNRPLVALVAMITFLSYVFLYTPLKRKTTFNTLIGAVPGALPPVIGWTLVRDSIDRQALALFLILFLWQVPHFLAIAWIYRGDYARAGLRMLSVVDPDGGITGRQMLYFCLALVSASLLPVQMHMAGPLYLAGAALLGCWFLSSAIGFLRARTGDQARRVLKTSLLYLPALFALLLVDNHWLSNDLRASHPDQLTTNNEPLTINH